MVAYILFDSLYNSLFSNIFCFEEELINLSYYAATLLVGAHWFGVLFPKLQIFSGIFWVLLIGNSLHEKTILGIFVYLFIQGLFQNSKEALKKGILPW